MHINISNLCFISDSVCQACLSHHFHFWCYYQVCSKITIKYILISEKRFPNSGLFNFMPSVRDGKVVEFEFQKLLFMLKKTFVNYIRIDKAITKAWLVPFEIIEGVFYLYQVPIGFLGGKQKKCTVDEN